MRRRNAAVVALAVLAGLVVLQAQVSADYLLGSAQNYAVLGGSTVTNTGPTTVNGNLGLWPGTSITGFALTDGGPGLVTQGTIHIADSVAKQAQADALTAYNSLAGLASPPANDLTGLDLGGRTLLPGVYNFDTSAGLTGMLTLDGNGELDPLFVFKIGTTLTTASLSSVLVKNGADAGDVYFQVGTSATLGTGTSFIGTLIASADDTLTTGVYVDGRVIALTGAVTLDANRINNPTSSVPEPGTLVLLLSGVAPLLAGKRQRLAA